MSYVLEGHVGCQLVILFAFSKIPVPVAGHRLATGRGVNESSMTSVAENPKLRSELPVLMSRIFLLFLLHSVVFYYVSVVFVYQRA